MALIRGSNRSDTLTGKNGRDAIFGRSGNDTMNGKGGRDLLDAGNGNDTVTGGIGNDTILGGSGTDTAVFGGSADSTTFRLLPGGFLQVRGIEGADILKSVEYLKIGGKTYSTKGPIARTDEAALGENQPIDINVLANDQSLSKGALRIQKLGGGNAAVGDTVALVDGIAVKLGAGNRLTFDPGTAFDNLSAGETLHREFTYRVGNGSGKYDTAKVNLTIQGRNDGPAAVSDAATTNGGTPLTIAAADLLANDTDIDLLDVLTVTAVAANRRHSWNGHPGEWADHIHVRDRIQRTSLFQLHDLGRQGRHRNGHRERGRGSGRGREHRAGYDRDDSLDQ
ncbi:hypothetical protein BB934_40310 (plasmid) [Microvirga ossetica]|uniref:RapA2 cadherin-like domain-containing protein n=1 Tax=Microvirga ossetica TaxID=1882682 RepID=A0A1B2EX32_9HYPH|nr:Ig-like domain-containing protein [Microvirga ossetica]ANY84447.1 hypothetical protein BB934_40310 [Microvirga ossetica]